MKAYSASNSPTLTTIDVSPTYRNDKWIVISLMFYKFCNTKGNNKLERIYTHSNKMLFRYSESHPAPL